MLMKYYLYVTPKERKIIMTEQEWLEYVDKLTLQAALRQTIKQDPNSLKNPMMQDILYY